MEGWFSWLKGWHLLVSFVVVAFSLGALLRRDVFPVLQRLARWQFDVGPELTRIQRELHPNGGTSLRDAVDSIASSVDALERQTSILGRIVSTETKATWHGLGGTGVGLWMADHNGRVTDANTAFLELAGMTHSEVRGNGWKAGLHPDDLVRVGREWKSAVDDVRMLNTEVRFLHRSGETVTVSMQVIPIFYQGELSAFCGRVLRCEKE